MERRRLLAALGTLAGAGTAGCLAGSPGAANGGPTRTSATRTPTETSPPRTVSGDETAEPTPSLAPPSASPRTVSLSAVDSGLGATFDVAADVSVVDDRITGDSAATVRVRLRNRADARRKLTYVAEECGANYLFGNRANGQERLVLVPGEDVGDAGGNCWRTGPGTVVVSCGIPATTNTVELPAGGRVTWSFECLQTAYGRCLPPGRYAFGRQFGSIASGDDGEGSDIQGTTATLAFDLELALES